MLKLHKVLISVIFKNITNNAPTSKRHNIENTQKSFQSDYSTKRKRKFKTNQRVAKTKRPFSKTSKMFLVSPKKKEDTKTVLHFFLFNLFCPRFEVSLLCGFCFFLFCMSFLVSFIHQEEKKFSFRRLNFSILHDDDHIVKSSFAENFSESFIFVILILIIPLLALCHQVCF